MITLVPYIGPSLADLEEQRRYETLFAWAEWEKYCCVEWNGTHDWIAEIEPVDAGGDVSLRCRHCPANTDDLLPNLDATDIVFGEVDGIPVDAGKARSLEPYTAPVEVTVEDNSYYSYYYGCWEPDVTIVVTSRPGCVAA